MTVEKRDTHLEALRLAVEYLAAGLGELELAITRAEAAGRPRPLAVDDAAGNVAQALGWTRAYLSDVEGPTG